MNKPLSEVAIGIDLGTTNSEVACIYKGKSVVIGVDHSKIMPSVVSLDESHQILVGKTAVNNELIAPTDTIRCIKRKMGRSETIPLGDKLYTPPMISSLILARLKQAAEDFLGVPVTQAVITVPAFFNEQQREATKEAADLAGLETLRLLNEPTAAALVYASGVKHSERCLVYDLGGGTFDVSIVDFSQDVMEVRGSHGDTELGGADFDQLIAEEARQEFLDQHGIDLFHSPISKARLLRAAEAAKIRLSTESEAVIYEEFIASSENKSLHLEYHLSRTQFESMIEPTLQRSLTSVRKVLEISGLTAKELDRVILVGGSTYIPLVAEMLEKELEIVPQAWINPATVVALGAAIEAGNLTGQATGPMMVDVTPHSLGIACLNEHLEKVHSILIHRNTPIPTTASHVFFKISEEQESFNLEVYQGESRILSLNQHLGTFKMDNLTPGPNRELYIKFDLDRSGLLHVTATEMASGAKINRSIRRVSHSRVQHVNLADLESVRIKTEQDSLPISGEEECFIEDSFAWDIDEELQEKAGDPSEKALESEEIIEKAKKFIEERELEEEDLKELTDELALAMSGDDGATKRISELLYYME